MLTTQSLCDDAGARAEAEFDARKPAVRAMVPLVARWAVKLAWPYLVPLVAPIVARAVAAAISALAKLTLADIATFLAAHTAAYADDGSPRSRSTSVWPSRFGGSPPPVFTSPSFPTEKPSC